MAKAAYLWRATEEETHAAIVQALRIAFPKCLVAHVPNGEKRDFGTAVKLKHLGVVAGMPDLVVALPNRKVAWIEVKAAGGRLSPQQTEVIRVLTDLGHPVCVARDIGDAVAFVRGLMKERAA